MIVVVVVLASLMLMHPPISALYCRPLYLLLYSPLQKSSVKKACAMDKELEEKLSGLFIWCFLSFLFSTSALIGSISAYVRANEAKAAKAAKAAYFSGHSVYGRMANNSFVTDEEEALEQDGSGFGGSS